MTHRGKPLGTPGGPMMSFGFAALALGTVLANTTGSPTGVGLIPAGILGVVVGLILYVGD